MIRGFFRLILVGAALVIGGGMALMLILPSNSGVSRSLTRGADQFWDKFLNMPEQFWLLGLVVLGLFWLVGRLKPKGKKDPPSLLEELLGKRK